MNINPLVTLDDVQPKELNSGPVVVLNLLKFKPGSHLTVPDASPTNGHEISPCGSACGTASGGRPRIVLSTVGQLPEDHVYANTHSHRGRRQGSGG